MRASTFLLAIAAQAIGSIAFCTNSRIVDGRLQAYCTDEVTGLDFIYEDIDGHAAKEAPLGIDMGAFLYAEYLKGISNATITDLVTRSEGGKWQVCKDKVAGVCSNKHAIAWTGSGAALITTITAVISSVNHKTTLSQKPRSKCTYFKNDGTVCVSWAAYYHSQMSEAQVKDISRECEIECGKQKLSCESRLVTDNSVEYFCVSNRATGCEANNGINNC